MKPLSRRRSLGLLSACAAPMLIPGRARAQTTLPDKALRILVGYASGGGIELMARAIASRLQRRIGRHVTVQNKRIDPDAVSGTLFHEDVARGLVVAFLPSTTLMPRPANSPFPFDTTSTLVPLTTVGALQIAFAVSPQTGLSGFADYASWVTAKPAERAQLGTTAADAYLTVYSRMIGRALGIKEQIEPQRGAARLVDALVESRLPAGIGTVPPLLAHNYGGEVRILMTSGHRRLAVLQEVPTAAEVGHPDLELHEWYGFFASSASPPPVVAEWNRQLRATLEDREVVAALEQFGVAVETSTPAETQARLTVHSSTWDERMAAFGTTAPASKQPAGNSRQRQ